MKTALEYIQEGLHGQSIEKAMQTLEAVRRSNPIAWFVIFKVLDTIKDEWEEDILPIERANHIENTFKGKMLALLQRVDGQSLNEIKSELEDLVRVYVEEYITS